MIGAQPAQTLMANLTVRSAIGEYLEIDRPRRLAFEFAVPKFSPQRTRVTIEINPLGTGCELVLTHEGVHPDYASRTEGGWGRVLDGLAATLN